MKIDIGIKWQLMAICILLVIVPTVLLGVLSYNTFRDRAYANIEDDLSLISRDWGMMVKAYNDQMERVLKREEFLVEKRLASISLDVNKWIEFFYDGHNGEPSKGEIEALYDKIATIKIGRSGYVAIIDGNGNYIISKDRQNDGVNIWDARDADGNYFIRETIANTRDLVGDDYHIVSYPWRDFDTNDIRMKFAASTYFGLKDMIIAATSYYIDFKSYELQRVLQDELEYKMAEQRMGEQGYIWAIDSNGNYICFKRQDARWGKHP